MACDARGVILEDLSGKGWVAEPFPPKGGPEKTGVRGLLPRTPAVYTLRKESNQERLVITIRAHRSVSETHCESERTRYNDVPADVDCDGSADVAARVSETRRPDMVGIRTVLGNEDIHAAAGAADRPAAEIGSAYEISGERNVAASINRYPVGDAIISPKSHGPYMASAWRILDHERIRTHRTGARELPTAEVHRTLEFPGHHDTAVRIRGNIGADVLSRGSSAF